MRIVLVRHGKAESHAADDASRALTEKGLAQAQATGEWLRDALGDLGGARLLASPYRRAQETAAPLAALLGLEVQTVAGITPDADPRKALPAIEAAGQGAPLLLVVSHMPLVAALAGWLQEGGLNTGRAFDLAEARVLAADFLAPGLAREIAAFIPHLKH